MARERGKKISESEPQGTGAGEITGEESGGTLNNLPEMMRRVVSAGLSGFFFTEETIRKAFGDTVPREWTDFATQQSERARSEFFDRLGAEIARTLEKVDLGEVLATLLADRTVEVKAEFRLRQDSGPGESKLKISAKDR